MNNKILALYNLAIHILSFFLWIIAPFNSKIKLGVTGRNSTFKSLDSFLKKTDKTLWFHCSSLGEYEQGLPVFEILRNQYPQHKIILSFFSPSGYEIRKTSSIADLVVYLPLDTASNAKRFINIIQPEFTVFVKYDIWPNLLLELKHQDRRAILISALFKKHQTYFKFYGGKLRKALHAFEHVFVQDNTSKALLSTVNFNQVTVAGDTRYDRVSNQLDQNNELDFIAEFKTNSTCVVIGSSWPEDEAILIPYINAHASDSLKFIIAPHEVDDGHSQSIRSKLSSSSVMYSQKEDKDLKNYNIFIINTIGLLSKIYHYADIAYVGGAMGKTGLHNILEPSTFGIPVLIGKNYTQFPEASAMIKAAGVISVNNAQTLDEELTALVNSAEKREQLGHKNLKFLQDHTGAALKIMTYIKSNSCIKY